MTVILDPPIDAAPDDDWRAWRDVLLRQQERTGDEEPARTWIAEALAHAEERLLRPAREVL